MGAPIIGVPAIEAIDLVCTRRTGSRRNATLDVS